MLAKELQPSMGTLIASSGFSNQCCEIGGAPRLAGECIG
jgi:hypothetical protein